MVVSNPCPGASSSYAAARRGSRSSASSGSEASPSRSACSTRCRWCSRHGGVGRSLAAVARGGAGDQRVDVVGDAGLDERGHRHVVVDVAVGDLDGRLALVRLAAGEQLVEDDTGGVDVGARVGPAVDHQLGGQVGHGADQHPAGGGVLGVGAHRLGETEVGDLDPAAVRLVGDQDVLGLHVAVDQPGPVGRGERRDDRLEQGQRPARRHRALLADHVAQGVPRDVLHDQEDGVLAVGGVVALVVDPDDVRVVEPRGGAGLPDEPLRELLVVTEPGVHHLHRDGAVEPGVGGFVDAGHATTRHPGADAVATVQQPPDHGVARGAGRGLRGRARVAPLIDLQSRIGAREGSGATTLRKSRLRPRSGAAPAWRHAPLTSLGSRVAQEGERPSSRRRLIASTLSTYALVSS